MNTRDDPTLNASEEWTQALERFWSSVEQGRTIVIDGKASMVVFKWRPVIVLVPLGGGNTPIWQELTHTYVYDSIGDLPEVSDTAVTDKDDIRIHLHLFAASLKRVALLYHRHLQHPCLILYNELNQPCLCFDLTTRRPLHAHPLNTPLFPTCSSCHEDIPLNSTPL